MRSDSSTCAGSPEDILPATYLTSGENARTGCSRARLSPSSLYRRHSSLSSTALTLVSTNLSLPCLRARMGLRIGPSQPLRLYLRALDRPAHHPPADVRWRQPAPVLRQEESRLARLRGQRRAA